MSIYTPYTYLIGWSRLNTWYYGVRYALKTKCLYESGCHPDDLWVTYFSSSKHVKRFVDLHGDPDIIEVRKKFPASSKTPSNNEINELASRALLWEEVVLTRIDAVNNPSWLNKNVAGDYRSLDRVPNNLKHKTYTDVYGEEKAQAWIKNKLDGAKRFWESDSGISRKSFLSENPNVNLTPFKPGTEPYNKIKETFIHVCEICGGMEVFRRTSTNLKRKTCGSRSCATKWSFKYKKEHMKPLKGGSRTTGMEPANKIHTVFNHVCVVCGNVNIMRDTKVQRSKLTCSKSCAAKYSNEKRKLSGYIQPPRLNYKADERHLITNGTETKSVDKTAPIPMGWYRGRHYRPRSDQACSIDT